MFCCVLSFLKCKGWERETGGVDLERKGGLGREVWVGGDWRGGRGGGDAVKIRGLGLISNLVINKINT